MIRVYIDTNVFLNVWNKEIDTKTKAELWKSSAQVLQLVEEEKIRGITSLTTLMEVIHAFRRRKRNYEDAIGDCDYLITRDEDFAKKASDLIKACTPEEFLKELTI